MLSPRRINYVENFFSSSHNISRPCICARTSHRLLPSLCWELGLRQGSWKKNEKSNFFVVENLFKHETLNKRAGGSDKMCKIDNMMHLQSNSMAPGFLSHCSSSGTSENTAG